MQRKLTAIILILFLALSIGAETYYSISETELNAMTSNSLIIQTKLSNVKRAFREKDDLHKQQLEIETSARKKAQLKVTIMEVIIFVGAIFTIVSD